MSKRSAQRSIAKDTSDKPYVANYPPLRDWLEKHEARCNWQLPLGDAENPQAYVESYQIGGSSVIVVVHANRNGWYLFTQKNTNSVSGTLADAEERIGRRVP